MAKEFPNRIRELREQLDWSQRDLSAKTKIDFSTIQKLETGDTRLDVERMRRIAAAFGTKASALLLDEDVELRATNDNLELLRELEGIPDGDRASVMHMTREMVRLARGMATAALLGGDERQAAALADIWRRFDETGRQDAIDILAVAQRSSGQYR